MITAVSEAGMNRVVPVGTGVGEVTADAEGGTVQARIADIGPGIRLENLPRATLKKGFTTVVAGQDRVAPVPAW